MENLKRNIKGAYTVWYRDVVRFRRDRMRIVSSLVMPVVYLFLVADLRQRWRKWVGGILTLSSLCSQVF